MHIILYYLAFRIYPPFLLLGSLLPSAGHLLMNYSILADFTTGDLSAPVDAPNAYMHMHS